MTSRRSQAAPAVVLVAALILAGCNTAQPVASTSLAASSAAASASPALTPVPGGSAAVSPPATVSPPTQTETEWGRIWDALPAAFPLPPGASPTESGEGPASAILDVPMSAEQAATTMQSAMTGAGFTFDAMNGPSEDGGYTLEAVGQIPACRAQVRAAPLGDRTVMTILYGASCPFG